MQLIVTMLLMLHPGHEVGCESLPWDFSVNAERSRDTAVLRNIADIKERAGTSIPIEACASRPTTDMPYIPIAEGQVHEKEDGTKVGYVLIPNVLVTRLSRDALRGLVAHEIGHFAEQPSDDCLLLPLRLDPVTEEEKAACQMPADAKAAEWVGIETVVAFLTENSRLLAMFLQDDNEKQALMERTLLRIDALGEDH